MEMNYHNPVLLKESVDGLAINKEGTYVDVTFGGGGHSREILSRLNEKGRLIAFDQDADAQANVPDDPRFQLIAENFRYIGRFLKFYGILEVDGILGDFGVSSHQFDVAERGFSTRSEARLDMRMDRKAGLSAYEVVNQYDYDKLRKVLFQYGELRKADPIARAIVQARSSRAVETTADLKKIVTPLLPKGSTQKLLAQLYQAIRIEVNQELQVLEEFLLQTPKILRPGGRLSLISYHSLEDRLVKRFVLSGNFKGEIKKDFYGNPIVPFKKVGKLIVPSASEIAKNNRARSAKLRVAERIIDREQ